MQSWSALVYINLYDDAVLISSIEDNHQLSKNPLLTELFKLLSVHSDSVFG